MKELASFKFEVKNIPGIHRAVKRACMSIERYWKQNVKKYFNAHELYGVGRYSTYSPSQIVDAIHVSYHILHDRLYIVVSIKDLIGKKGFNYRNALEYGVPAGKGAFVPSLGVRIDYGRFGGSSNKQWLMWITAFERHIDSVIIHLQSDILFEIQKYARS